MTARIEHQPALAMIYGARPSDYQGEFLPAIAEIRVPVRIVSMRRSGSVVLLAIAEGTDITYLRVSSLDDPRLQVLGANDRSRVHSALATLNQGGPPDAAA